MKTIFLISPTESLITERGKRHPHLASYLVEKGYNVRYVTSTINHASKRVFSKEEIKSAKNKAEYPIVFLGGGLYRKNISFKRFIWNLRFAYKVYKTVRKEYKVGDILIFPSRPSELLFVASLLKKKKQIKLFIDIEDIWPDAFLVKNKFLKKGFYAYCNMINSASIPCFDGGVHVSPNFKKWLDRYSPKFNSIFTPLGINDSELIIKHKRQYKSVPKPLKLFYGGTLTLQFDILPVLKAIANSKRDITISVAGDNGTGERYNDIINYAKYNDVKLEDHKLLPKNIFLQELGKADIVIIPMVSGGLPKKFYDAIGSYKPILCLGSGGTAEEVKEYGLGWSTSFDEDDILEVLNKIDENNLNVIISNINKNINRYLEISSLDIICKELNKL